VARGTTIPLPIKTLARCPDKLLLPIQLCVQVASKLANRRDTDGHGEAVMSIQCSIQSHKSDNSKPRIQNSQLFLNLRLSAVTFESRREIRDVLQGCMAQSTVKAVSYNANDRNCGRR